jgi:germination protein M
MLEPELRDIHSSAQWTDEAKQIMGELIRGSNEGRPPALSVDTRLRSIFWAGEGLCVVDLTREAASSHPGGLTSEVSTVYAIVNSLTENLTAVRKVQILIEGNEVETLAGHVDISQPMVQDLSMTPLPPRD